MNVKISDSKLREAASNMDDFLQVITDTIYESIGGELNAETMPRLSSEQITLLGYMALREEVMDGGFIQLIHNGWGGFIFLNRFDSAIRRWGLEDLCRLIRRTRKLYDRHHQEIEQEMSDEQFMAMFEQLPQFDDADDEFVENEETYTGMVAYYVDEHLDSFVEVVEG